MIPAAIVFLYLATVVYIGVFAFRRASGKQEVEDFFLARRSLGPFVFLMSLFGTNMTAFAILGSSGHAFNNGIVTFGLMASSSGLVIPLTIFLIGTRVWALGKRYGFDGLESTTHEIERRLESLRPHKLSLSGVSLLLEQCDLVKFARAAPDLALCEDLWNGAIGLVRATTPPAPDAPAALQGPAAGDARAS